MDGMIPFHIFLFIYIRFSYIMYMVQIECKFLYCGNVIIFEKFMYWFFNQCYFFVCIYLPYIVILVSFVALNTCLTIFNGEDTMIWVFLSLFKIWNLIVLLGDKFAYYSSGVVIFMQFSKQPKTQFQFGIMPGDELIYLQ